MIYLIGSLRNEKIPEVANQLEKQGLEVFDNWFSAGPEADSFWNKYERNRGRTYTEALKDYSARQIFDFDKRHLDRCDAGVLIYPAGKSGHLELGYLIGKGKRAYVLLDKDPERWDVMLCFATNVYNNIEDLVIELKK